MILRRILLFFLCIIFWNTSPAFAQQRITAQLDVSRSAFRIFEHTATQVWSGAQIEYEQRFKNDKLWNTISGFAIGGRHEKANVSYGGSYITARAFKAIDQGRFTFLISGGVVYGLAGNNLNRVWQEHTGKEQLGYVQVFQVQNVEIPFYPTERAGVLYPEITLSLRRDLFDHIGIEPFVGLRFIKFHAKKEDFRIMTTEVRNFTSFVPTFGLRLSYKF